jgi:hypothetical protein
VKFAAAFFLLLVTFMVLALKHGPSVAFYLYEMVYFLNPQGRWWGNRIPGLSYSFYIVAFMFALIAAKRGAPYNKLRDATGGRWVLVIFISYAVVTFLAVNTEQHNRALLYLINSVITMGGAYVALSSPKRVRLAILFYMIAGAYIGYEAMVVGRNSAGRIEGIGTVETPDANTIACSIVPCIAFAIYFLWQGNKWMKITAALCGLVAANGLILINSRGAFLGVGVSFGFFMMQMVFSRYRARRQRVIALMFIVASSIVAVRLVDDVFIERMLTLTEQASIESEGSGGRRMNFWLATFDMVRDHPLGTGIYGYETLSSIYLKEESFLVTVGGTRVRAVHSVWFQALSEIGWLGFFAFLLLLASLHRHLQALKIKLEKLGSLSDYYLINALQAGAFGYLVSASFINMFRVQTLFWLIVFAMALITTYSTESNQAKDQNKSGNNKP